MSNFHWFKAFHPRAEIAAPVIRQARPEEYPGAVRLILGSGVASPGQPSIDDYVAIAQRCSGRTGLCVAESGGKLVSAVLPVISPGRTMLLFAPATSGDPVATGLVRRLIDEACRLASEDGVQLAQALVDPKDTAGIALFDSCGFRMLAELIYLQCMVPRDAAFPFLPPGMEWRNYSAANHDLFARAILATYQNSLDCPALAGLRSMDDVIEGHKVSGDFSPSRWFVLCNGEVPLGVLLLGGLPQADALEVVYLGLAVEGRGLGLGDLMMQQAMAMVAASDYRRLSLAVDAGNQPALKRYYRHGLHTIGRKSALIRRLDQQA